MRISDWSSDVCSSDLVVSMTVATPAAAAFPTAFRIFTLPKIPREKIELSAMGDRHRFMRDHRRFEDGRGRRQMPAVHRLAHDRVQQDGRRGMLATRQAGQQRVDRKTVVEGKGVSVSVELGGRRTHKKKTQKNKKESDD